MYIIVSIQIGLSIFILCASLGAAGKSVSTSNKKPNYNSGDVMFRETFRYANLDSHSWSHELNVNQGGNWEFEIYNNSAENTYILKNTLHLKPTLLSDNIDYLSSATVDFGTKCTDKSGIPWFCARTGSTGSILPPIASARINTMGKFYFTYGRLEVCAKLPSGDWIWPAIWLLPQDSVYGGWPMSGEIDLMESRGNKVLMAGGVNIGSSQFASTLHFGSNAWDDRYHFAHYAKNSPSPNGYYGDFHNYTLLWTPTEISFFVDGDNVGTVAPPSGGFYTDPFGYVSPTLPNPWLTPKTTNIQMAPFDQPFYIILNQAVGGTNGYFPAVGTDAAGNVNKVWVDTNPDPKREFFDARSKWLPGWTGDQSTMQIRSVIVYAL